MSKDKMPEPMDAGVTEIRDGQVHVNSKRNAYALVQLVDEVRHLFPETPYEFGNYNGRNTALSVTFDLSMASGEEFDLFTQLLALVKTDQRVLDVINDDTSLLVDLFPSPRYQDLRDSFNLADAYSILTGEDQ